MKKPLSIVLLLPAWGLHAQSVTPEVVATSGGYFTSVNAQLSWTLGEPVIDTWTGVSATLTQGFQQNSYYLSGISELPQGVLVTVYPNPSAGMVNITLSDAGHVYTQAVLVNAAGQTVGQVSLRNSTSASMDLSGFAPGVYVLSITDDKNQKQSMTIIKQ